MGHLETATVQHTVHQPPLTPATGFADCATLGSGWVATGGGFHAPSREQFATVNRPAAGAEGNTLWEVRMFNSDDAVGEFTVYVSCTRIVP